MFHLRLVSEATANISISLNPRKFKLFNCVSEALPERRGVAVVEIGIADGFRGVFFFAITNFNVCVAGRFARNSSPAFVPNLVAFGNVLPGFDAWSCVKVDHRLIGSRIVNGNG